MSEPDTRLSICPRVPGRQRGMALVVTLWILALLALVAAAFMADSRTQARLARNLVENAKAEAIADAGVYRTIAALLDPDPVRWPRADGTTYRWSFGGGEILVSVQDETGKIDLNTASGPLLEGLFVSIGAEPEAAKRLVAAIHDFGDADIVTTPDGAEDPEYRATGRAAGAMDGPFDRVADLQQVLGVTLDLYERVAPVLTVYSGSRSINPATAPRGALLALPGAKPDQVDALISSRAEPTEQARRAGRARSTDEEAAPAAGDVVALLDDLAMTDGASTDGAAQMEQGGGVYTITAVASTPNGGTFGRLAVVRLTGDPLQPFIFHEWHRGWASPAEKATTSPQ